MNGSRDEGHTDIRTDRDSFLYNTDMWTLLWKHVQKPLRSNNLHYVLSDVRTKCGHKTTPLWNKTGLLVTLTLRLSRLKSLRESIPHPIAQRQIPCNTLQTGFLGKKALWLLSQRKRSHYHSDCLQGLITARTKSWHEGTFLRQWIAETSSPCC